MATLPEDGDYVISDSGVLGSNYSLSVVNGPFLGEYKSASAVCRAIRHFMDADQFWPNIFRVSDHGNVMHIRLKGGAV